MSRCSLRTSCNSEDAVGRSTPTSPWPLDRTRPSASGPSSSGASEQERAVLAESILEESAAPIDLRGDQLHAGSAASRARRYRACQPVTRALSGRRAAVATLLRSRGGMRSWLVPHRERQTRRIKTAAPAALGTRSRFDRRGAPAGTDPRASNSRTLHYADDLRARSSSRTFSEPGGGRYQERPLRWRSELTFLPATEQWRTDTSSSFTPDKYMFDPHHHRRARQREGVPRRAARGWIVSARSQPGDGSSELVSASVATSRIPSTAASLPRHRPHCRACRATVEPGRTDRRFTAYTPTRPSGHRLRLRQL